MEHFHHFRKFFRNISLYDFLIFDMSIQAFLIIAKLTHHIIASWFIVLLPILSILTICIILIGTGIFFYFFKTKSNE